MFPKIMYMRKIVIMQKVSGHGKFGSPSISPSLSLASVNRNQNRNTFRSSYDFEQQKRNYCHR